MGVGGLGRAFTGRKSTAMGTADKRQARVEGDDMNCESLGCLRRT